MLLNITSQLYSTVNVNEDHIYWIISIEVAKQSVNFSIMWKTRIHKNTNDQKYIEHTMVMARRRGQQSQMFLIS